MNAVSSKTPCEVSYRKQKGVTLIEIMVAMIIVLIVLAVILLNLSTSTRSSSLQRNLSQMMENGQTALNIIARDVRNAGYEEYLEVPEPLRDRSRMDGSTYLRGCQNGTIPLGTDSIAQWGANEACVAGGASDSIAVRYQAGQLSQIPSGNVTANDLTPRDCRGNDININDKANLLASALANNLQVVVVDNRYWIGRDGAMTGLMCWGNGLQPQEPVLLVPDIEQMRLEYGVSERMPDTGGASTIQGQSAGYMSANALEGRFAGDTEDDFDLHYWDRVTAVRVCIVVRSREPVADAPDQYINCDGNSVSPGDRHLHRTMHTVIDLRNVGSGF